MNYGGEQHGQESSCLQEFPPKEEAQEAILKDKAESHENPGEAPCFGREKGGL